MHKSRLAGFIIDCQTDDIDAAASFWSQALGYEVVPPPADVENGIYRELDTGDLDVYVEIQKVDHPSRVHLDIQSDDLEAEVARLEGLGARKIGYVKTWCVMEAPTGQRFCIVNAGAKNFDETANTW